MPEPAAAGQGGTQPVRLVVDVDPAWCPAWRDGLETYPGVAAELLAAHRWAEGLPTCAACSWSPTAVDAEERHRQHCEHQAALLPALEVFPRVHDDVALLLLDAAAARVEAEQLEAAAVLTAHAAGWSWARLAGVLGRPVESVRRVHRQSTAALVAPVVHRDDGPPSDRGAA